MSTNEQQRWLHCFDACYRFTSDILDVSFGVGGVHTLVIISTSIPYQTICVMVMLQIKFGVWSRAE